MISKKLIISFILIFGYFFHSLVEAAPVVETVEYELRDSSGIKLQIFKKVPRKGPRKNTLPPFPEDLEISDKINYKKTWFPWDPRGTNNYPLTPECRPETLRDHLWSESAVSDQAESLNHWGHACRRQFVHGFLRRGLYPLIRYVTMDYDFWGNPNIHHVRATLPDGRVLDGFVAIKPDGLRRPFVIAKCGVLCNAEQSITHRVFMMHLFDESPFNVLSLANNTGSEFQKNNQAVSVGGFDEGRQLYRIAQLLRSPDSPIHDRISSVHVTGVSLGAAGALYSGLYSSLNDPVGKENIQSVIGVCPVIVLENSMKSIFSSPPISTLATIGILKQIRKIFSAVPIIGEYFSISTKRMPSKEVYQNLSSAIFNYYQDWTYKTPWDLKPFEGLRFDTMDQFWEVNDFRNYYQQTKVPTLTLASQNDEFVKTEGNSKLLAAELKKAPNPYVASVFLPLGNHCAFGISNGWSNYSTILREYILSHSPEAELFWHKSTKKIPKAQWRLRNHEIIVDATFESLFNSDELELKLKIFSPYGKVERLLCAKKNPYRTMKACYREAVFRVPMKDLPLENKTIPETKFEVTALTRYANTRLSVLGEDGKLIVGTNHEPHSIQGWVWK